MQLSPVRGCVPLDGEDVRKKPYPAVSAALHFEAGQEIISGHQMERFGKLLEKSIRCSDVYTRYSLNKYLVLLTDFGEKQAAEVAVQLCQNWKAFEKEEKVRIELEIQEVEAASEKNNI